MINPLTVNYNNLKNLILSGDFPWFVGKNDFDNFHFLSHPFLTRPESGPKYPTVTSVYVDLAYQVFVEICEQNNINVECVYRMGANMVFPSVNSDLVSNPHVDHQFPHSNMIIYLTSSGGSTIVGEHKYAPVEDGVFVFEGESHYHELPKVNPRIVFVATFLKGECV